MTQKELLSLEHLKIAEVKPGYFLHVHAEDGFYMTDWKEGDDIKKFNGSVCIYAPIRDEYKDYRIITADEFKELEKQQREAIEKEMEEERNKRMEDR